MAKSSLFSPTRTSISDVATTRRRAQYVAKLWRLIGLLRAVAHTAAEAASLSEQFVPRARLTAIQRRVDGRIRELLQKIDERKAGTYAR
jgi:hypothetical protein